MDWITHTFHTFLCIPVAVAGTALRSELATDIIDSDVAQQYDHGAR
jgi:hypothetical protein